MTASVSRSELRVATAQQGQTLCCAEEPRSQRVGAAPKRQVEAFGPVAVDARSPTTYVAFVEGCPLARPLQAPGCLSAVKAHAEQAQ